MLNMTRMAEWAMGFFVLFYYMVSLAVVDLLSNKV
jgi:hypothetical protein